ncbi:hypothetical protein AOA80_09175 [Methanomassiliicoccales archaeon RumEn M1]|jgi:hypothetical protein|nr:hypothetical protein AOA80_09175 [Methanomassiliicoccales archaeon RumEn M1]
MVAVTTCRCTATKHATAALAKMDRSVREEVGWGEDFDGVRFNRFMDAFRTIFFLRRGLQLSGYGSMEELHAGELSDASSVEDLRCMSDIEAALMLFRARAKG